MQIRIGQKRYQAIVSLAPTGGEAAIQVDCLQGSEISHPGDSSGEGETREIKGQVISSPEQTGTQGERRPVQVRVAAQGDDAIVGLAAAGGEAAIDVNCSRGGEILHSGDSAGQREGCGKIQEQVVTAASQTGTQS